MSTFDMTLDILQRAQPPLHALEIITQGKAKYGLILDRESLISALVKKVHRNQGVIRFQFFLIGASTPSFALPPAESPVIYHGDECYKSEGAQCPAF